MSKYSAMPFKPQSGRKPTVDISQAIQKQCPCGSDFFKRVYKVKVISALAPGNELRQDIPVEIPVYVCVNCGKELGAEKVETTEEKGEKINV